LKKINVRQKVQDRSHSVKNTKGDRSFIPEEKGKAGDAAQKPSKQVTHAPKVGRNEPCPCGSGKKYKKCCLK